MIKTPPRYPPNEDSYKDSKHQEIPNKDSNHPKDIGYYTSSEKTPPKTQAPMQNSAMKSLIYKEAKPEFQPPGRLRPWSQARIPTKPRAKTPTAKKTLPRTIIPNAPPPEEDSTPSPDEDSCHDSPSTPITMVTLANMKMT